jgi:Tol biopolymer transport system component/predicted Ser/Thr protein kinase
MPILPGRRLGPYEILSAIGAGGMGEVYKARDTRLDRIVAIKVLPTHLADRSELRERFEREARTIASLNHPHICVLHDIGQQDGIDFLVMEYLEGETLAQRLLKGALPIQQVLQYAIEIADALDKAHRKGITHRDLKPGNIMLTKSGTKLLDFGLAKLTQEAAPVTPVSQLPTLKSAVTAEGTILGTLQYMAPEQVEAKEVDARTDIFAFGAVVYEMATGKKAFEGKTSASVMAAILKDEPPAMSSLTPMTPPTLDRVVKKCLAKEPEKRWQAASDVCDELKWIAEGGSQAGILAPVVARHDSRRRTLEALAAMALLIAIAALTFAYFRRSAEEARVLKFPVLPPEKSSFEPRSVPAVSPDGRRLAFALSGEGKDGLWVRELDSVAARQLPGTDGAHEPFWSPDSHFIAFFADGKLKKIDVTGGPAITLCDASVGYGGSWNTNDVILFSPVATDGLFRVPAAGGRVTRATALDQSLGEITHRFPWFLPDGRHFLYTGRSSAGENTAVYVGELDSKSRRRVVVVSSNAVYSPPGYLLFLRQQTLMAQPFNADKAQTTGDPIPIAEQVVSNSAGIVAQGQFSASQNGALAYISGSVGGDTQLTWLDRSGKTVGAVATPGFVSWAAISPDGNTVAEDHPDPQTGLYDIWLHDLARGTNSRFTLNSKTNRYPIWSPDGSHIAFSSNDGLMNVYQRAANGIAQDEPLDKADGRMKRPDDWSRDGRYIIEEVSNDPKTGYDIWVLPLSGDRKPFPYLNTEFNEHYAKLSPNGQWLAYVSDETKREEVYVQTFPAPGGKWQVSTNGGSRPVWSRDGKELFFIGPDQKLMAVEVKNDAVKGGAKFEAGVPKPLFVTHLLSGITFNTWFDVSKDGRFIIPTLVTPANSEPMTVVVNWTAGLKK